MKITQICLLLTVVFLEKATAIKCLQCTTTRSSHLTLTDGCAGVSPTTCSLGQNYCKTTTSTNNYFGTSSYVARRDCAFGTSEAQPCRIVPVLGIQNTVCTTVCNTDGCNRESGSSTGLNTTPTRLTIPFFSTRSTTTRRILPFFTTRSTPFTTFTQGQSALSCYQCTASSNTFLDTCSAASPQPCRFGETRCISTTTVVFGVSSTQRGCASQYQNSGCRNINGYQSCSSLCYTDACNNGNYGKNGNNIEYTTSGKKQLSFIGFFITTILSYAILNN